jgi:serine protease Do
MAPVPSHLGCLVHVVMNNMRKAWPRIVAFALALDGVLISGAGTEALAQYSRRTPIVEAVQKTHASIVTVKVEKKTDASTRKEIIGTGVVVDERGYVITNCHVVAGGERVRVHFSDGSDAQATVLKEDPSHDLAVLRVHADKKLKALPFGPSSDLMVGETVIAVGHPYGYTNTVSKGIISGLNREITMPTGDTLKGIIQTDASINPGNSGGPLLNINGELIGISVAFREGAQGIGFAMNADSVQQVLSRHLSASKLAGVYHGLRCKEMVEEEGRSRQHLVVAEINSETPAALAGLQRGDTLIRVGDQPVANRFDLERALWESKPGKKVDVAILRQGKQKTVALHLISSESDTVRK